MVPNLKDILHLAQCGMGEIQCIIAGVFKPFLSSILPVASQGVGGAASCKAGAGGSEHTWSSSIGWWMVAAAVACKVLSLCLAGQAVPV